MTSKYVMASRARHVTFPRVFPIGQWGAFDTLSSLYTLGLGTCCIIYPCQEYWKGVGLN